MSKTVRQLDREGFYVGDAIAHEHPKRPGEYILPGGAVDTAAPPALTEGQRARWVNDAWQVVDPDPVVPPDQPTLEEAQEQRQDELAAKRWQVEYSGFTVASGPLAGLFIDTSEKTRAVFDTAHRRASEDPNYTIRAFKSGRGSFAPMSAATIILIGDAIEEFIQQCFEHESVLDAQIQAAGDVAAVAAVDIESGWPT